MVESLFVDDVWEGRGLGHSGTISKRVVSGQWSAKPTAESNAAIVGFTDHWSPITDPLVSSTFVIEIWPLRIAGG